MKFDQDYIGSATWHPISIEIPVVTGKTYWIILKKVGADASNTYRWYHDGGATGTYADSADGEAWNIHQNDIELAFKTYYGVRIIACAADGVSAQKYLRRDHVVDDPSILSRQMARKRANMELERLRDVLRDVAIPVETASMLNLGELVDLISFWEESASNCYLHSSIPSLVFSLTFLPPRLP